MRRLRDFVTVIMLVIVVFLSTVYLNFLLHVYDTGFTEAMNQTMQTINETYTPRYTYSSIQTSYYVMGFFTFIALVVAFIAVFAYSRNRS